MIREIEDEAGIDQPAARVSVAQRGDPALVQGLNNGVNAPAAAAVRPQRILVIGVDLEEDAKALSFRDRRPHEKAETLVALGEPDGVPHLGSR